MQPEKNKLDEPAPTRRASVSERRNSVSLTICVRAVCCLALPLAGCGTVKPEGDYRHAADLVTNHTGAVEVYDPAVDPLVEQKVGALLQDGLHLDEAVQVALLNNRAFQSLFLDIGVSRAEVVQSGMLTNPSLSLLPRIPDIGGRIDLTVGFAQEIADLWQIPVRKKIAQARLEKTVLKVADAAVALSGEVKTLYFQLVTLSESVRIAQEDRTLLDESLALAQHRFDAGETTLLDVNLVKSDVVAARMRLATLERDQEKTRASLARVMGIDASDVAWQPVDPLQQPVAEIADNAALIDLAMAQRLDAQMGVMEIRAAERELAKESHARMPSVVVGGEMERNESKGAPAPDQANLLTGPSLQAVLPVWDQNRAVVEKARMQLLQKRKDQEELSRVIREEVEKAAVTLRKAAELLRLSEQEALPQAQQNNDTARRVYEAGEDSILVVIAAHKTLIAVRDARNQALGEYAAAMVELERAVGGRLDGGSGGKP